LDIGKEGHIDHLIRGAIRKGVVPEVAYRAASWSVARHYQLRSMGAIAPGYIADLVLLNDPASCEIYDVLKGGIPVAELETGNASQTRPENTIRAAIPETADLTGPGGRVHAIGVKHGRIITDRSIVGHDDEGVARLSVLERHGKGSRPANGYVTGFGKHFHGTIASSVGHDSHNLIAVGKNPEDMRLAFSALTQSGGGFCVVENGVVHSLLPLPFGGLMSMKPHREIETSLRDLKCASQGVGCELPEPFLQLAFLSLPVIPSLKLTDQGLVDVDQFKIIDVRA
jgi:adenine deaminase